MNQIQARATRVCVIGDDDHAADAAKHLATLGFAAVPMKPDATPAQLAWLQAADALLLAYGDYDGEAFKHFGVPVYDDAATLQANHRPLLEGDPRFYRVLGEMGRLHAKKNRDYGTGKDPFANVRAGEDFGTPAWIVALSREHDKTVRLKSFIRNRTLANEGVEDSLIDKANYSAIALILFREAQDDPFSTAEARQAKADDQAAVRPVQTRLPADPR